MPTVQIAPGSGQGLGGVIQGLWGTYTPAADGSYTVDGRDVPPLLAQGFNYVKSLTNFYTTPIAPLAATVGRIVASGALSNGTVAISNQPDVMRPVTVEVGTGTAAITAGNIAVTYVGNDGQSATENYSLVCTASSAVTQTMSRGVVTITSIAVTGVVGGTSPWLRMSSNAQLSLPVAGSGIDFSVTREYDAGATIAIGTLGVSLASIAPTTAPNGTNEYSFAYNYTSPIS
jgi:hypothetical protein